MSETKGVLDSSSPKTFSKTCTSSGVLEEMRNTSAEQSFLETAYKPSVRMPWVILVHLREAYLYSYFGAEDTLRLLNVWSQNIQDIIEEVLENNPYVYDRDECLRKVLQLKRRFEETNANLVNPMPICCIAVTRAEFDPLPPTLEEMVSFVRARSTTLYFSPDATEQLDILRAELPEHLPIPLQLEKRTASFLDQRSFMYRTIKDTNRIIVKDAIFAYLKVNKKKVAEQYIHSLENCNSQRKIFVSNPEKRVVSQSGTNTKKRSVLEEVYLVCSFWSTLDFDMLYETWQKQECAFYISRLPEISLTQMRNGLYVPISFSQLNQAKELTMKAENGIIVDAVAVPYCEGIENVGAYTLNNPRACLPAMRIYSKQEKPFVFCGTDCMLERIEKLEQSLNTNKP